MNSILLDNQIINALTLLEFRVIKANNFGYYDINKKIQGYLGRIIDVVYFNGENRTVDLDTLKPNYPAIDLANYKYKIAYQITAETNTKKIYSTLNKFVSLSEFKSAAIAEIRFLIIRKIDYTPKQLKNIKKKFESYGLKFDENTLITIPMLESGISKISNIKKEQLVNILNEELNNSIKTLQFATIKDIDDLKELYAKDRFQNIGRIDDAMEERHLSELSKILGIDIDELKVLDYKEVHIDRDNGVNSIVYRFIREEETENIIERIHGINNDEIEIFPWDWAEEEYFEQE